MAQNTNSNLKVVATMIFLVALSRLIPHPANFAPMGAMAIFGAYYFKKNWHALAVTLSAWWLSDVILNNTVYKAFFPTFTWFSNSYITIAIALIVIHLVAKIILKNTNTSSIIKMSLISSILFFVISNFGSFLDLYPKNMAGIVAAYTAGLPFLKNTLLGDLFYTGLLFGIYHFVASKSAKALA